MAIFGNSIFIPKNPDSSKVAILRTRTPAIEVQTLPLQGPRILKDVRFLGAVFI